MQWRVSDTKIHDPINRKQESDIKTTQWRQHEEKLAVRPRLLPRAGAVVMDRSQTKTATDEVFW